MVRAGALQGGLLDDRILLGRRLGEPGGRPPIAGCGCPHSVPATRVKRRPRRGVRISAMPPAESLERLGDTCAALESPVERKRMLVIVNPYATTVSDRLQEPRRLRAPGPLRGRRGRHRAPRPRHRAVPRGRARGLRRRRRLRRRRHGQRGRQRPGRLRHPADLPARRRDERLLQDARHPRRHRRRHRAPAAAGRRLAPAPRRPRHRQRPPLHVLRRLGLDAASSSASTPTRSVKARLRRGTSPTRRSTTFPATTSSARRGWRCAVGGETLPRRHRDRPERRPLHLLRRQAARVVAEGASSTTARSARRRSSAPRRSTSRRSPRACSPTACRSAKHRRVARPRRPARVQRCVSTDGRPVPLQVDGDHIGDVDRGEPSAIVAA